MTIIAMIALAALNQGVDPNLAIAIAQVESNLNPNAVGKHGEIGLFQIMPSSYPDKTRKQLFESNIELGIRHIAWSKKHCKHTNGLTFVVCYNFGVKNAERVKYPTLFPYYKKVLIAMEKFKKEQKVMILNLYGENSDGKGTYLGITDAHGFKGYYRVQNDYGHVMHLEPIRVVDYNTYWEERKRK